MSHYCAYVLIPAEGDPEALVSDVLAPFDHDREVELITDDDGDTYWHNPVAFWDFWQIGGRWSGALSGYDPRSDPDLLEVCFLCEGTGLRDDDLGRDARRRDPSYTCNGCQGQGKRTMWPTNWPAHEGDVQDAVSASTSLTKAPYSFLVHGGETVHHREVYRPDAPDGERFVEVLDDDGMRRLIQFTVNARIKAGIVGDRIVVVDYHN